MQELKLPPILSCYLTSPTIFTVNDNIAPAFSIGSSGKADILNIVSTDNSEGVTMSGKLDVTGATGIDGDFDIASNKFTVAAATGNTSVAGTLGVDGDFDIASNKFTVAAATEIGRDSCTVRVDR